MKDLRHFELIDYLRIPWNRRWYFLAVSIIVIAGVSIYAYLHQNLYRSETRIVVESATLLDDPLSPTGTRDRTEERVNGMRQLLESRSTLSQIVEEFRSTAFDTSLPLDDAIKSIRDNLEVSKASGSVFTMAYSANDPQVAQAVTKRLADILISVNQMAIKRHADDKDQFIEEQLAQAKNDLEASDRQIKEFKAKHLGQLPEQGSAIVGALTTLNARLATVESMLDRAREQEKTLVFRLGEQAKFASLAKRVAPSQLDAAAALDPAVRDNAQRVAAQLAAKRAELADKAARYQPAHPDVVHLAQEVKDLEQQLAKIVSAARSAELTPLGPPQSGTAVDATGSQAISQAQISAEAAQIQFDLEATRETIRKHEKDQKEIQKRIDGYQAQLGQAPAVEQDLAALMHEHDVRQQQVQNLQARQFNARMASNALSNKNSDIYSIQDEASTPRSDRPVFPSRLQILLMGIGAGFVAGFAAAFTREYLEPSIANEEEAAALLRIPILVSIPEISERPRALLN